jgi:hypothetical protein
MSGAARYSRWPWVGLLLTIFIGILSLPQGQAASVRADASTPTSGSGVSRQTVLTIDIIEHEWWVVRWKNSWIECDLTVDHDGMPTSGEILAACGKTVHEDWADTPTCSNSDQTTCAGVYMAEVKSDRAQRKITVDLPPAEAWLSLNGCTLEPPENKCDTLPDLVFTGLEPLPNESIVRIQGMINGDPFTCPGDACVLPLRPTADKGLSIEFWAESSFGDSSPHYTALVRVMPWGDFTNPENANQAPGFFYVDVLSSQWRGQRAASCTETWQVFPDVGGPPHWLSMPKDVNELSSSTSLYYLAGMLIQNGIVDATGCPDGGLGGGNAANACGVDASRQTIQDWQNQFDTDIYNVAKDTGVPAFLLKNIFNRESQFWPGIYQKLNESGLGQMTDNGADTILLWNSSFYDQFCPLVLSKDTCQKRYNQDPGQVDADPSRDALTDDEKSMLRGALVMKTNADCPTCQNGIDLSKASFSINVFAQSLLANCQQTGQIIYNTTQKMPGTIMTYQDLWRLTLVNYNAGSGCLATAISKTNSAKEPLDWEHVSANLEEACQGAIPYVQDVTELEAVNPTPTPWTFAPTATPPPPDTNQGTTPEPNQQTPEPNPDNFGG